MKGRIQSGVCVVECLQLPRLRLVTLSIITSILFHPTLIHGVVHIQVLAQLVSILQRKAQDARGWGRGRG